MLESFEKTLTVAILDECGLVLENEYNRIEKRRIEEKARAEELRSNLLRAISHDLRTPLTNISGTAALLMENELSEEKRRQMYVSVYDDAHWLIDLVENLLSITRMEGGSRIEDHAAGASGRYLPRGRFAFGQAAVGARAGNQSLTMSC